MLTSHIPKWFLFAGMLSLFAWTACKSRKHKGDDPTQTVTEIRQIDTLLRDTVFAEFMARSLDSSYNAALGQAQPDFLAPADAGALQPMRLKDETTGTSIAGFYALECGLELLSKRTGESFVSLLQKVTAGTAGREAVLLLNRLANATWKAGQPFRSMARLQRYNFTVASLLSREEEDKDSIQIVKNARRLLPVMLPLLDSSRESQMSKLRSLLHDTVFAVRLSSSADSAFAASQGKSQNTASPAPDTGIVFKTVKQIKLATSLAGFYALECGVNYLVTTKHLVPSAILKGLANDSLDAADKDVFARFANATWKAGQPFRGLNRITRETFTPFYYLSGPDIDKDLVQVKAAARILLSRMEEMPVE